jgi:crotonobetainyl-CoA:carnitine CoA-transferase CaiB-like acyl-CoA transferase
MLPQDGTHMLCGVRVIDLTTFLSGPFATQMLADLGADVIKVESAAGDSSRHIPPHFVDGISAYFHSANRSKRSIELDLKNPAGRDVLLELVRTADVVIDNFRTGVLAKLAITHEQLAAVNPTIVSCSITGFGESGPYRDRPAYDAIVQAMSGAMSLTGHVGGPPARMGLPMGDLAAGLYASAAIAAALVRVCRGGGGDHIEISMLDCQLALLSYQAAYYLHDGAIPGPQGAAHDSIPTYRSFQCADGRYLMVTANTDAMWRSLCSALGVPHLVDDPQFADASLRLEHRDRLWDELEARFRSAPADELMSRLIDAGVPVAPINDVAEALDDQNTTDREMVLSLTASNGVEVRVAGNPIKSATGGCRGLEEHRFPPHQGQDTAHLLRELGYTGPEVESLRNMGALGPTAGRARA